MNIDFSGLEKQGYVVIPNFLSVEEIDMFITDKNSDLKSFRKSIPRVSKNILEKIAPKILNVAKRIADNTSIKTNVISPWSAVYMNTFDYGISWHQDQESWYVDQHHENYLNFYISIIKPDSCLSGLSVIPYDVIDNYFPEYKDKFLGKGAKTFETDNVSTKVVDDDNGEEYSLPINIDNFAVSPELSQGDLLILRGDVIHRTQDVLTNRLSVTIRCLDGNHVVNKKKMLTGCKEKISTITKNPEFYRTIVNAYGGKENITVFELYKNLE